MARRQPRRAALTVEPAPPISVPSRRRGSAPPDLGEDDFEGVLDGRARGLDPVMNAQQWILPKGTCVLGAG